MAARYLVALSSSLRRSAARRADPPGCAVARQVTFGPPEGFWCAPWSMAKRRPSWRLIASTLKRVSRSASLPLQTRRRPPQAGMTRVAVRQRAPCTVSPHDRSSPHTRRKTKPSEPPAIAASASAAPPAGADPAAAGSRSAAMALDWDQAAAREVAVRASFISFVARRTDHARDRLPTATAHPRRHYQILRHHQTSAAMPPPCSRDLPPL
jgi:hypothetical protein